MNQNYPELSCAYCFSNNTYVVQLRKNTTLTKPIYRCTDCKRRFTPNNKFKKFRYSPIVIKTSLDLLSKGISLGKITNYLRQNFRVKVTRKTILDWKNRFLSD